MSKRDLIIGLDLASVAGWAVFDLDGKLVESGSWDVSLGGDYQGDRWLAFHVNVTWLFERYAGRVAALVMERPVTYGKNPWSTSRVLFGQASIAEMVAARNCCESLFVHPAQLKKRATGQGNATKRQVIDAMVEETGPLAIEPGGDTKTERARRDKARSDEADARAAALWLLDNYEREDLARGELVAA